MLVGLIDLFFFFAISLGADSLEIEPSPISILRSLSLIRLLDSRFAHFFRRSEKLELFAIGCRELPLGGFDHLRTELGVNL